MLSNYDKARLEQLGQDVQRILGSFSPSDLADAGDIILGQSPVLGDVFNIHPSGKHECSAWIKPNPIDTRA